MQADCSQASTDVWETQGREKQEQHSTDAFSKIQTGQMTQFLNKAQGEKKGIWTNCSV